MKAETSLFWGNFCQAFGLVCCGLGCGLELALRADWCFVLISVGSVFFAVGCKLKGK